MRKICSSVAGDRVQTVHFALADFYKSRLLCKDARYDQHSRVLALAATQRVLRQAIGCQNLIIHVTQPLDCLSIFSDVTCNQHNVFSTL